MNKYTIMLALACAALVDSNVLRAMDNEKQPDTTVAQSQVPTTDDGYESDDDLVAGDGRSDFEKLVDEYQRKQAEKKRDELDQFITVNNELGVDGEELEERVAGFLLLRANEGLIENL